jgi:hypothetical protein
MERKGKRRRRVPTLIPTRRDGKGKSKSKSKKARRKKTKNTWEGAEVNLEEIMKSRKEDDTASYFGGRVFPESTDPSSSAIAPSTLCFAETFKKNVDIRLQMRWLTDHMEECPLDVVSMVVNVVVLLRGILHGGIMAQMSMPQMSTMGWERPAIRGNQRTYAAGTMHIKEDSGIQDRGSTTTVYPAGKLIMPGPPRVDLGIKAALAAQQKVQRAMPHSVLSPEVMITNIVTDTIVKNKIDLGRLHSILSGVSKFQPTNFPALIIKLQTGVTVLVYASGHVIATGSPEQDMLFLTTMFFITNFVIFCVDGPKGSLSLEEVDAEIRNGNGADVIGANRPHMVSDLFASERVTDQVDLAGAMHQIDAAGEEGVADIGESDADEIEYSDSDSALDIIFTESLEETKRDLRASLVEEFEGTAEELEEELTRRAKSKMHRAQIKNGIKRQKIKEIKQAEEGKAAASLSDLTVQYPAAFDLLAALSQM